MSRNAHGKARTVLSREIHLRQVLRSDPALGDLHLLCLQTGEEALGTRVDRVRIHGAKTQRLDHPRGAAIGHDRDGHVLEQSGLLSGRHRRIDRLLCGDRIILGVSDNAQGLDDRAEFGCGRQGLEKDGQVGDAPKAPDLDLLVKPQILNQRVEEMEWGLSLDQKQLAQRDWLRSNRRALRRHLHQRSSKPENSAVSIISGS